MELTKEEKDNALTRFADLVDSFKKRLNKFDRLYLAAKMLGLKKSLNAVSEALENYVHNNPPYKNIPYWSSGYGSRKRSKIDYEYWDARNGFRGFWRSWIRCDERTLDKTVEFPYLFCLPILNGKLKKEDFKFISQLYRALTNISHGELTQVVVNGDDKDVEFMLSVPYYGKDRARTTHYRTVKYRLPLTDYITWLIGRLTPAFGSSRITCFGNGIVMSQKGENIHNKIVRPTLEQMKAKETQLLEDEAHTLYRII